MKFKVKVDLSMMDVFGNALAMSLGFGIVGVIIVGIIGAVSNDELVYLFLILYLIIILAVIFSSVLKATLNNTVIGSSNEETKTEKLLKEVLEELRELKNNQNKE
jgi:ABC-type bacteriocin/lantibiotic exporter with double-glycine peptidase domain